MLNMIYWKHTILFPKLKNKLLDGNFILNLHPKLLYNFKKALILAVKEKIFFKEKISGNCEPCKTVAYAGLNQGY